MKWYYGHYWVRVLLLTNCDGKENSDTFVLNGTHVMLVSEKDESIYSSISSGKPVFDSTQPKSKYYLSAVISILFAEANCRSRANCQTQSILPSQHAFPVCGLNTAFHFDSTLPNVLTTHCYVIWWKLDIIRSIKNTSIAIRWVMANLIKMTSLLIIIIWGTWFHKNYCFHLKVKERSRFFFRWALPEPRVEFTLE